MMLTAMSLFLLCLACSSITIVQSFIPINKFSTSLRLNRLFATYSGFDDMLSKVESPVLVDFYANWFVFHRIQDFNTDESIVIEIGAVHAK